MHILTFENLKHLDHGSLVLALDEALRQVYRDCDDRPGLKKPRSIKLTLEFTPQLKEDEKNLNWVAVTGKIGTNVPDKSTTVHMKAVHKRGGFGFEDDTASLEYDPDQKVLQEQEGGE